MNNLLKQYETFNPSASEQHDLWFDRHSTEHCEGSSCTCPSHTFSSNMQLV